MFVYLFLTVNLYKQYGAKSIYSHLLFKIRQLIKFALRCKIDTPSFQRSRLFSFIFVVIYSFFFLSGLPFFTKIPPSLVKPVQHTNFEVVCQAEGFPRPVINWSRRRKALPAGRTEVNQGTLTIKNLISADNGLYECIATNIIGTKKATIYLAVQQQKLSMLFFLLF